MFMISVRNNRFLVFLCYDNDSKLLFKIVIVYPHCHSGGAIGIARVVRPHKLKSNSVDLRRNILDQRKTDKNNQNGLGLNQ